MRFDRQFDLPGGLALRLPVMRRAGSGNRPHRRHRRLPAPVTKLVADGPANRAGGKRSQRLVTGLAGDDLTLLHNAVIHHGFTPRKAGLAGKGEKAESDEQESLHNGSFFVLSRVMRSCKKRIPPLLAGLQLIQRLLEIFFNLGTLFRRQHLVDAKIVFHTVVTYLLI